MELKVRVEDTDFTTAIIRWYNVLNNSSDIFECLIPPASYEWDKHPFLNGHIRSYYLMTEESAAKIAALNGPHYRTMIKAWVIRMGKAHRLEKTDGEL